MRRPPLAQWCFFAALSVAAVLVLEQTAWFGMLPRAGALPANLGDAGAVRRTSSSALRRLPSQCRGAEAEAAASRLRAAVRRAGAVPRASLGRTLLIERLYYLPPRSAPLRRRGAPTGFEAPPAVVVSLFNEAHTTAEAGARFGITLVAPEWAGLRGTLRSPRGRHFRCVWNEGAAEAGAVSAAALAGSTPLRHYAPTDEPSTCRDPAYRWTPHLLSCAVPRAVADAAACAARAAAASATLPGACERSADLLAGVVLSIVELVGVAPAPPAAAAVPPAPPGTRGAARCQRIALILVVSAGWQ